MTGRRCWCNRPVAKDQPDATLCAEHDDPPPPERHLFPSVGAIAAGLCAFVIVAVLVGFLFVAFGSHYAVLPSPDGPVVVERTR